MEASGACTGNRGTATCVGSGYKRKKKEKKKKTKQEGYNKYFITKSS